MTAFDENLFVVAVLACTLHCAGFVSSARALPTSSNGHSATSVTAESRFGNGSITAPIRYSEKGWEVLLPGGHWVYCRRSCAETLRVETIDFFNANSAGSGQLSNECGIFGCLDLKYAK